MPTRLAYIILFLFLPLWGGWAGSVYAQDLQDLYAALSDLDDFDEEGWQEAYEILTTLAETPQNINEATFEDFQQVPLLPERQAAAILHYRSLFGDLHSMSELQLITAIDRPRQLLLTALFYAKPTKDDGRTALIPKDSATISHNHFSPKQESRGNVLFSLSVPAYERAGYKDGAYKGYALNHTLRASYSGTNYQLGFTAAQDAGEPFFAGTNKKGWDFYTGYLRLKNIGILKNLVAGHYQLSIGMGLLINNSYRLSRTSMLITPPSFTTTLRGHTSRQESNYLQGVAGTIALPGKPSGGNMTITAFASYRPLDATMSSTNPATVTTILTTGYHRTESEIARRSTTRQTVVGASVGYTFLPFRLALSVLHVNMRDSLLPNLSQKYRYYAPKGTSFTSGSLTYAYTGPHLQFSGETALSSKALAPKEKGDGIAVATMNNIYWRPHSNWTAFAVQRYYSYRYQSLLGKSFGDVSNVQNESGIYLGATTTAISNLSLSAYTDIAYHPWYRYGYDGSSQSWDTYILTTYTTKKTTATLRLRYRKQEVVEASPSLEGRDGEGAWTTRFSLKHTFGPWTSTSQAQASYLPSSDDGGWLVSQALGYKKGRLTLWASLAYFDTSDYASRLYLTDRALTYGSTTTMLYGNGIRANVLGQWQVIKNLSASLRCHYLHYFDRDQISSSHQLIDSSSQTDLQLQVMLKF